MFDLAIKVCAIEAGDSLKLFNGIILSPFVRCDYLSSSGHSVITANGGFIIGTTAFLQPNPQFELNIAPSIDYMKFISTEGALTSANTYYNYSIGLNSIFSGPHFSLLAGLCLRVPFAYQADKIDFTSISSKVFTLQLSLRYTFRKWPKSASDSTI
jgi:hypothetical protein